MVCPRCGKETPDDTKFCLGCGLALFVVAQQAGGVDKLKAPAKPYKPFPVRSFALGLVAALVVGGVFWSIASSGESESAPEPAKVIGPAPAESAAAVPAQENPADAGGGPDVTEVEPEGPVVAEISAPAVAFKNPEEAFAILGMPESTGTGTRRDARYAWGLAGFEAGRLTYIEYNLKPPAKGTKEALARIGLEQTSRPAIGTDRYVWDPATNQHLLCCGLEMDEVAVLKDLSRVTVHFYRRRQ